MGKRCIGHPQPHCGVQMRPTNKFTLFVAVVLALFLATFIQDVLFLAGILHHDP